MVFFYIILLIYIFFLLVIVIYFNKAEAKQNNADSGDEIFLSVIIPVRDEPDLYLLIEDLLNQSLSADLFEIIVVDDHSTIKYDLQARVSLLMLDKNKTGKKAALTAGIEKARGDVIITTDGDCRVRKGFLKNIYSLFLNTGTLLSPGLVKYSNAHNLFQKMQAMELLAIMGSGVAFSKIGFTSLSNGANLAFKKSLWQELGGYKSHEAIPSGDDEFFVQQVAKQYPDKIFFRKDVESIVSTDPHADFISFFNQRIRWAGKWKFYKNKRMATVAAIVFLFHIGVCGALISLFSVGSEIIAALILVKIILEGILIFSVANKLKSTFNPLSFILLQFLYSPYVVFFGITANFVSYSWKGRKFRYN